MYNTRYSGVKAREGFNDEIDQRIKNLMDYMSEKHGKVFYCRVDLRFRKTYIANKHLELTQFLTEFRKAFEREVRKKYPLINIDLKYIWKAERDGYDATNNHHYHIVFTCNANAFWSLNKFMILINYYWNKHNGWEGDLNANSGLVNASGQSGINGTVLRRNDSAKREELYTWLTYIAKNYSSVVGMKVFDSSEGLKNFKKGNIIYV